MDILLGTMELFRLSVYVLRLFLLPRFMMSDHRPSGLGDIMSGLGNDT